MELRFKFRFGFNLEKKIPRPIIQIQPSPTNREEYILNEAESNAANMVDKFGLDEKWGFTLAQEDLFESYFSGYFLKKINQKTAHMITRPEFAFAYRIPIFNRWAKFIEDFVILVDQLGDGFHDLARRQSLIMSQNPELDYLNFLTKTREKETDETRELDREAENEQELMEMLKSPIGRPYGIQNAANILSTLYIKYQDKKDMIY